MAALIKLNLDEDLRDKLRTTVEECAFENLPLAVQLGKIHPILQAQQDRDEGSLSQYMSAEGAVANG